MLDGGIVSFYLSEVLALEGGKECGSLDLVLMAMMVKMCGEKSRSDLWINMLSYCPYLLLISNR